MMYSSTEIIVAIGSSYPIRMRRSQLFLSPSFTTPRNQKKKMATLCIPSSKISRGNPNPKPKPKPINSLKDNPYHQIFLLSSTAQPKTRYIDSLYTNNKEADDKATIFPIMSEITAASKAQNLHLQLQTLGPFFRIRVNNLETKKELGRAVGVIRVWFGGRILHMDSIRLSRETLSMQRSIFGIGLFIGAVAIRHGFDQGCRRVELLAINDSDLYHSKLVRFYTRMGFKAVHEVTGSSIGDLAHMLVWGGKGTRMDADVEELLTKWGGRFKARN